MIKYEFTSEHKSTQGKTWAEKVLELHAEIVKTYGKNLYKNTFNLLKMWSAMIKILKRIDRQISGG